MAVKSLLLAAALCVAGCASEAMGPDLSKADEAAPEPVAVWLDVDIGIGFNRPILGIPVPGLHADPDDAYSMIMGFHSPELDVRGVSVLCGNYDEIDDMTDLAQETVDNYGPAYLRDKVYMGGCLDHDEAMDSPAVEALAAELRERRMTILALGPLTNVAAVIKKYPELSGQIDAVIAVAGMREGEEIKLGRITATDFNLHQDIAAAEYVYQSDLALILTPFELSSKVFVTRDDLDLMANSGSEVAAWLAEESRGWISNWSLIFGVDQGFNPFDTLALGVAMYPEQFVCEWLPASFDEEAGLRVSSGTGRTVQYCTDFVAPLDGVGFKDFLVERILGDLPL
jgi:inosine-uridine nucleoside N-ribohydrolase